MAFTIVFATPGFSAKVNERKVLVATMLDMLVKSLQSSSLICQFSRQRVTVGNFLLLNKKCHFCYSSLCFCMNKNSTRGHSYVINFSLQFQGHIAYIMLA